MVRLALLLGSVLAPVVSLVVFLDATRRSVPASNRWRWSILVGLVSLVGFLIPSVFARSFHRLVLTVLHGAPVVVTPMEVLLLDVGFGSAVTIAAVLAYVGRGLAGRRN
mgnify:CR=1 FL=1